MTTKNVDLDKIMHEAVFGKKEWYILRSDKRHGPFLKQTVIKNYEKGTIGENTLIYADCVGEWQKLKDCKSFKDLFSDEEQEEPLKNPTSSSSSDEKLVDPFVAAGYIASFFTCVVCPLVFMTTLPKFYAPFMAVLFTLPTIGIGIFNIVNPKYKKPAPHGFLQVVFAIIGFVVSLGVSEIIFRYQISELSRQINRMF